MWKSEDPIHPDMLPFVPQFEKTALEYIQIYTDEEAKPKFWNSKFGGYPYLTKNQDYPTNRNGEHLLFLAQINFEELPPNDLYPKQGLLQFFINDDKNWGYRKENPTQQDFFKIIYYTDIQHDKEALIHEFSFLRKFKQTPLLGGGRGWGMEFETESGWCPISDYQFDALLGNDFFSNFGEDHWNRTIEYEEGVMADGNKMGGYGYFANDDPRTKENPLLLLLQVDSDGIALDIPQLGILHFFIAEEDLKNKDFSKVFYFHDDMDISI